MSNIDPSKPATGNATTQSVRDNFQAAADEIDAVQTQANGNTGRIDAMEPGIADNKARLDTLEPRVTVNEQGIATNAANIAGHQTAIDLNTGRLDALEPRVTANETSIGTLDGRVTANEGSIGALDTRVTANEGAISTNAGNIGSNIGRLDALEPQVSTNTGNIATNAANIITAQGAADAAQGTANQAITDAANANANAETRILRAGDTMAAPLKGPSPVAAEDYATRAFVEAQAQGGFESGTVMLFYQAAAPLDWTQVVTQNDVGIRIVSGAGGGVVAGSAWSTIMAARAVSAIALTEAQIPPHLHTHTEGDQGSGIGALKNGTVNITNRPGGLTGGGETHDHAFDMAVTTLDVILASKN